MRVMLGAALGAYAVWTLLGPEIPPRVEGAQQRPLRLPGRTVVVGRHEYFVREAGPADGSPIVLLHGWVYDGLATWHKVIPALAEDHRVYAIDLRAHGKTDRIRGRHDIADAADEVAGVLDALGLGPVPVVGYSMGGMIAQSLAARHRGRVARLILAATAARPVGLPRWVTVPVFFAGRAAARLDRSIVPRIVHRYLVKLGAVAPEHAAWLWEALMDRDVDLYYEAGFAILRFDGEADLSEIEVPTLSIIPTRDQLIPSNLQRRTAGRLADNRIVEIEGGRHEAVLTHPFEVAKAIRGFLA
jgi:pimeloyl-ACP methyl ester carboxylesterase